MAQGLVRRMTVLFILMLILPTYIYAHAPSDINIEVNLPDNLYIRVKHIVLSDPDKHYVKRIEVLIDDRTPIVRKFFYQVGSYRTLSLSVPNLEEVNKIIIRAYSTKGSFLEKEFHIKD